MTGPLIHTMIARLAEFVMANQHRVQDPTFNVGSYEQVRTVLGYHALQGTLRVEWGKRIASGFRERIIVTEPIGLAVVWRDREERLLKCFARDENPWDWQPEDKTGDCLYLALVITTGPQVLADLAKYFTHRYPVLPEYAYRRGKVRRTVGLLQRLAEVPKPTPKKECYEQEIAQS